MEGKAECISHTPYHINNGAVYTFFFPITGMISCFTNLVSYSSFLTETIQSPILPTTIRSQHLDSAIELTLEKSHEVLELLRSNVLVSREEYSKVIGSLIDEVYHVPIYQPVFMSHRFLEIRANYSANNVDWRIVACILP